MRERAIQLKDQLARIVYKTKNAWLNISIVKIVDYSDDDIQVKFEDINPENDLKRIIKYSDIQSIEAL